MSRTDKARGEYPLYSGVETVGGWTKDLHVLAKTMKHDMSAKIVSRSLPHYYSGHMGDFMSVASCKDWKSAVDSQPIIPTHGERRVGLTPCSELRTTIDKLGFLLRRD